MCLCSGIDIDECADDMLNNCDANAVCTDTDGSFNCQCNNGYTGNGSICFGKLSYCANTELS